MRVLRINAASACLLVLATLLTSCAQSSSHPGALAQHTATSASSSPSTLLPSHPLAWHPVTLPDTFRAPTVAFAGDGQRAYACGLTTDGHMLVWTTTDRAAHWILARSFPAQPSGGGSCELVVGQSDPSVAALCLAPSPGCASDPRAAWLTTTDSGAIWQYTPSTPDRFTIDQIDSRAGVIYAVRETLAASGNIESSHLWSSRDGMRSWQQVDHSLPPAMAGFWLQPGGRSILTVVNGGSALAPTQLFASADDGATWQALTTPFPPPQYLPVRAGNGPRPNTIVVLPVTGAPFEVCIASFTLEATGPNALTCSTDGGATWHNLPALNHALSPGTAGSGLIVGIASDRAILATAADQKNSSGGITGYTLYRLSAGASQWQPLGPVPQFAVTYVTAPGAGTLWAYEAPGIGLDPQRRLFIAAYG